jgi:flagella basal body P-ring formation protein FlgA
LRADGGWGVALLLAAVVLVASAPAAAAATTCQPDAVEAVTDAVRAVFGPDAHVSLEDPACEHRRGAVITGARPEPGSRTAGVVRFLLFAEREGRAVRGGRLTASVHVTAAHVRALVPLTSRTPVSETDIEDVSGDIGRMPFAPLPQRADVVLRQVRRPVTKGEVVGAGVVDTPPLVRSGRQVVTVARVQGIEVRGVAVAAQDGRLGDVVLVVNPDSRKRLRGRVVADSLVDVLHVS